MWFHRDYTRFTGGHLKHSQYTAHARAAGFEARVTFPGESATTALAHERETLWPGPVAGHWNPAPDDVLFLAGTDWRYLDARGLGDLPNPRINLVQHVRHGHAGTELFDYLSRRAVRICVSPEVADAVHPHANGPVLTIPAATDLAQSRETGRRTHAVAVFACKAPDLGRALSAELDARGVAHRAVFDFVDRDAFLGMLENTEVAVVLPRPEEGFYLPALEAMAAGCLVVTADCIGNRGFCKDGENCMVGSDATSLADAVKAVLAMTETGRVALHAAADATVAAHSLAAERRRFRELLDDLGELWRGASLPARRDLPYGEGASRPLVDFMVIGAQKCGTTALASFLAAHPEIGMAAPKEAHLFDDPDYAPDWTRADIDALYADRFNGCPDVRLRGEATPVYLYFPETAAELARYNPDLKVIVLLREPAERAVSHYYMQRARGAERRPLWLALLLEPFVLRSDRNPRRKGSPTRERGYRARGLYGRQLANLYRHVPRERVLLVHQADLLADHDGVLREVFAFLGADPGTQVPAARVFVGGPRPSHRLARALLRLTYRADAERLRGLGVRL